MKSNTKILRSNNVIYIALIVLSIFISSCNKKYDLFESSDKKISNKIIYKKDTIELYFTIKEDNFKTSTDTSIYIKKGNRYYNIESNNLVFSTEKDTLYTYKSISKNFFCRIQKKSNNYQTTFGNEDTLNFKYRYSLMYNEEYIINTIEIEEGKKKIILKKLNN